MKFDFGLAVTLLPDLLRGALTTFAVLVPTLVFGMLLGLPFAYALVSPNRWVRQCFLLMQAVLRGAPLLILLYFVYQGLPHVGIIRNTPLWEFFSQPYACAVLAFSINHAAFVSEIWRGGILSVPRGVREASESLGLRWMPRQAWIILPLAMRTGFAAYRNEVIFYLKGTAVVSAVTISDIMGVARAAVSSSFDTLTPFVVAGLIYWTLVQCTRLLFNVADRRLRRHI